jgi:hypothetical protein
VAPTSGEVAHPGSTPDICALLSLRQLPANKAGQKAEGEFQFPGWARPRLWQLSSVVDPLNT